MLVGRYGWLMVACGSLGLSCGNQALRKAPADGAAGITATTGFGGSVPSMGGSTLGTGGASGPATAPGGAGGSLAPDAGDNSRDSAQVASGETGGSSGSFGLGGVAGGRGGSGGNVGGATGMGGGGGNRDASIGRGGSTGGGGSSSKGGSDASGAGGGAAAGAGGGAPRNDGGGGTPACMGTRISASEANNYSFSSTLTFPPVKVKPKSDLLFDWSGVTADFIGHAIDPKKDLDTISVFEWDLTVEELGNKINSDTVAARDMTISPPFSYTTDGSTTSRRLLEFTLNGSPIEPGGMVTPDMVMPYFDTSLYDPLTHCFTVMAATGEMLGQGTRMIQSFVLDDSSSNTTVTMTKDSTKLEFHADLTRLTPTTIPAKTANVTLDWSRIGTNAMGGDFSGVSATRITSAFVAHYIETPAELSGDKFLDLELIATALFRKTIDSGTSVDLSTLKDRDGRSFSGIDSSGTWLFGLQCGDCRSPAPWYLTVLRPCG